MPPVDPPAAAGTSVPASPTLAPAVNVAHEVIDPTPPRRASVAFMRAHLAHWIALGFGSGLSPVAPGTAGTLWGWAAFALVNRWVAGMPWGGVIAAALLLGVWACARTAQALRADDPGAIVWDEIVAFWLVLWVLTPAGALAQCIAFALFRWFDAAKPGPVRWADALLKHHPSAWWRSAGILLDDLVAAGCTLLVMALWVAWRGPLG